MISVIMSTYKEPLIYIDQSMNSILNQTYRDLEFIVVVDDPENKGHIECIQEKMKNDTRVRLFINEKNYGLTKSLNKAISLSKGEFIARMDADDIAESDRLECQLEYLMANNLDLVGCNIRDVDEDGNLMNEKGTHYPTHDAVIKKYLETNSAIPHPTWLVRKKVYIESGLYCDFPACEDYEFLTRIALDSKKLGNVFEPKLRYRINSTGISCSKKVSQKTSFYYIRKNYINKRKSNLVDFYDFLSSVEGKKKQEGLQKYYELSSRLKSLLKEDKRFYFLFLGVKTFLFSKEGRQVVLDFLRGEFLRLQSGKKY